MNATKYDNFNYSSLIGIPYSEKHCWRLVQDFYKLVFNVELKHYMQDDVPSREDTKNLIYANAGEFDRVDVDLGLRFGDLILFKIRGIESHIGVYVGRGKFLHTSKGPGSVVEDMARWKHLVVGVYRLRGIA